MNGLSTNTWSASALSVQGAGMICEPARYLFGVCAVNARSVCFTPVLLVKLHRVEKTRRDVHERGHETWAPTRCAPCPAAPSRRRVM